MTQYRVIAEADDGDTETWEGEADDQTDAIMQSGFDEDAVIEVEEA